MAGYKIRIARDPMGSCPCCAEGGQLAADDGGLEYLICLNCDTKWFVGVGFGEQITCPESKYFYDVVDPDRYTEVAPLLPGERAVFTWEQDGIDTICYQDGIVNDQLTVR